MPAITTQNSGEVLVVGFTDSKILDTQRIEQVGKELLDAVSLAGQQKSYFGWSLCMAGRRI